MDIYDAAQRYREEGKTVMVLAGKEYGYLYVYIYMPLCILDGYL